MAQPTGVIAQIFGILAFVASVSSFQFRTYRRMMTVQTICAGLFLIHFYLLARSGQQDAMTGAALNGVCMIRNVLLILTEKTRTRKMTLILAVTFSVIVVIIGIRTWHSWASLLFIAAMVLNTAAFSIPDPDKVRTVILFAAPLACAYDALTGSVGGTVNEAVSFFSALIALRRGKKG